MRRQDESDFYVLFFCFFCEDVCVWILLEEIQSVFKQIIHVLLSWLENEGRKEQFSLDNEHQLCSDQNPLKYFGPRCRNIGPTSGQFQCSEPSMEGWFSSLSLNYFVIIRPIHALVDDA